MPLAQAVNAEHRDPEQSCGHRQQVCRTQRQHQQRGQQWPADGARCPARRNEAEQPPRLQVAEDVRHETPEDRHHEQVEDTGPDEKRPRHPGVGDAGSEQYEEQQQVDDEEPVDGRQEAPAFEARGHPAEQRHHGKHREKGPGEQPLQVIHPAGDAHLVTHRAHDVVAAQQGEEIQERPGQRGDLFLPHVDDAPQPLRQPFTRAFCRWYCRHPSLTPGSRLTYSSTGSEASHGRRLRVRTVSRLHNPE